MRRPVLFPAFLLLAAAALPGRPASAAPITIVNTGPGSGSTTVILDAAQWLAAEFIVSDSWLLTEVQGWIAPFETGDVRFRLYSDGGDVPGSPLFQQLLSIASTGSPDHPTAEWYGPSSLSWPIDPGSYWLAFEPLDTFDGDMLLPSPSALANEAFLREGAYTSFAFIGLGVRVFGEAIAEQPKPVSEESSSIALFGSVLLAASVHYWRRRLPAVSSGRR